MASALARATLVFDVVAEVLKLGDVGGTGVAVGGTAVAVGGTGVGVGGTGVGVGGTGVFVGRGVGVAVAVAAGAAEVTDNAPALPFQLFSVPQPGLKTPTAMEYAPLAAVTGTDHDAV